MAADRPHLPHRAERSRLHPPQNPSPHTTINRVRNLDPAAMETQIANRPRHENAIRWKRADLRLPSTAEAHSPAAIFLRALPVSHVYKIVRQAGFFRMSESGVDS